MTTPSKSVSCIVYLQISEDVVSADTLPIDERAMQAQINQWAKQLKATEEASKKVDENCVSSEGEVKTELTEGVLDLRGHFFTTKALTENLRFFLQGAGIKVVLMIDDEPLCKALFGVSEEDDDVVVKEIILDTHKKVATKPVRYTKTGRKLYDLPSDDDDCDGGSETTVEEEFESYGGDDGVTNLFGKLKAVSGKDESASSSGSETDDSVDDQYTSTQWARVVEAIRIIQ